MNSDSRIVSPSSSPHQWPSGSRRAMRPRPAAIDCGGHLLGPIAVAVGRGRSLSIGSGRVGSGHGTESFPARRTDRDNRHTLPAQKAAPQGEPADCAGHPSPSATEFVRESPPRSIVHELIERHADNHIYPAKGEFTTPPEPPCPLSLPARSPGVRSSLACPVYSHGLGMRSAALAAD